MPFIAYDAEQITEYSQVLDSNIRAEQVEVLFRNFVSLINSMRYNK